MQHHDEQHESAGYGTYVLIWLSLLILTSLTVAVAGMQLGALSTSTALVIAGCKAALVFLYFMHLKYESMLLKGTLLIVLVTMVLFIGLTFFDVSFR